MQRPLWNRFATFVIWLLAAGCVVYWALKFVRGPVAPPASSVAAPPSGGGHSDAQALARGLGGGQAPASSGTAIVAAATSVFQAARFVLTGVVVQKASNQRGVALIAVDGKPPRPYRVGAQLAEGVVLHSVSAGKAMLAASTDAAPALSLELPQLSSAIAGTAVALRPVMATLAPPIPSVVATQAANPIGALGSRPTRPLANQLREAQTDTPRDPLGSAVK